MTLNDHLNNFYHKYNIPPEGGRTHATFEVPLPYLKLTLPNFVWRKRMLFVHDLEHILHNQDTSWQGEVFIASWELSTGFFRNFPVIIFPLWTMGWGIWTQPHAVRRGFRKGHTDKGIAPLKLRYEDLPHYNLDQLRAMTLNKRPGRSQTYYVLKSLFWILCSQIVFLFPLWITAALIELYVWMQ